MPEYIRTAPCPTGCQNGKVLGSSGRVLSCGTCHGTGYVTPDHICYCGGSCSKLKDGFIYCGHEECLKNLKTRANGRGSRDDQPQWFGDCCY